jgi:alanyl-tRNA synthetase
MTKRLYYDDSHTRRFEASITERLEWEGRPAVVLDQTYFYPAGGGQPHDTGTLNRVEVVNVVTRPDDLAVLHLLESPLPNGDSVEADINWARRFDHMQQHTGQHILTQALVQLCEANTVGFHLSAETVTIDLDKNDLTTEQLAQAEQLANQVIWENQTVSSAIYQTVEDLRTAGVRMRRLPNHIATDGLRVVEIGTFDTTACGGTHVRATGEIGLLKIVKTEKRGDKFRIEFKCGTRALSDYATRVNITNKLTAQLTVGLSDLPDSIARLQEGLTEAQRSKKAAISKLIDSHAAELLAAAHVIDGRRVIELVSDLYDQNDLRTLAKKLVDSSGVIVLLAMPSAEKTQLILARSADLVDLNLNIALKAALVALGNGRGGGTPDFVQGGGVPATAVTCEAALSAAKSTL